MLQRNNTPHKQHSVSVNDWLHKAISHQLSWPRNYVLLWNLQTHLIPVLACQLTLCWVS